METLLSWLKETEAQMDGGMAKMEKMDKAEKDDNHDQLTQQLNLCKVSCLNFLIILNFVDNCIMTKWTFSYTLNA